MTEIQKTDLYANWFRSLRDENIRARINARLRRLELGNPGDVKPVGQGISILWDRLQGLFYAKRQETDYLAGWWRQTHTECRHKGRT